MWTITAGNTVGVSQGNVSTVLSIVGDAIAYWSRYVNFSLGSIEIKVNFENLGDTTLAQAGTSFTSVGGGKFQADTILELQDGFDRNGAESDIDIDVNVSSINGGEFYFGGIDDAPPPSGKFDLFTVLLHELGHGLGFLSFLGDPETAVFDTFVSGYPGAPVFTGAHAVAAYGGNVPLASEPSHLSPSLSQFVMTPALSPGTRIFLGAVDVGILRDVGLPVLLPTAGNDVLYGYASADSIALLGGNDLYRGLGGNDSIAGGDGDDTLIGGVGADTLDGGAGRNTASYADAAAAIEINLSTGVGLNDIAQGDVLISIQHIIGSDFNDTIAGSNGVNGEFEGEGGDDSLRGFDGDDVLDGGKDDDIGFGGDGNDLLIGAVGNDTLAGNLGDDTVQGGGGDDKVHGNGGNDKVYGGSGNDKLTGSAGADTLNGGDGDDEVFGNAGGDKIIGGLGNDKLVGLDGNDSFFAGAGFDTLKGGTGNDTLTGGGDADEFEFEPGTGLDVVTDFSTASGDVIRLKDFGAAFDDFTDVQAAASQVGADTVIDLGGGSSITLAGVNLGDFSADDFLFG
jgi:Ca2+-binding RTX toxin-like protein